MSDTRALDCCIAGLLVEREGRHVRLVVPSIGQSEKTLRSPARRGRLLPYFLRACAGTSEAVYLADLYDAWGKPDKAAEWRAKLAETEEEPESE